MKRIHLALALLAAVSLLAAPAKKKARKPAPPRITAAQRDAAREEIARRPDPAGNLFAGGIPLRGGDARGSGLPGFLLRGRGEQADGRQQCQRQMDALHCGLASYAFTNASSNSAPTLAAPWGRG